MTFRAISTKSHLLILGMLALLLFVPEFANAQIPGEESIKAILYFIVVGVFGWLLGIAGFLLDYAIENYVINFGTTFTGGGVGVAVDALWVTVRDFFNIVFIFGLVYLGFKMILNSDDSRTRSTLVTLIMAALLVNFSLFITKFVVDFSNILAREVAIAGFPASTNLNRTINVADTFFGYMQIQRTLDLPQQIVQDTQNSWSFIFGSAIVYLVGIFVFTAGALMLMIRFVALSIYMVLSPFMFIGWVFPGFQSMTTKYWSGFLGRAFYAPVYIILIYFAAYILNNMFGPGGSSQIVGGVVPGGAAGSSSTTFGGILAPFLLSSAFLVAAIQVAGKLSADGSGAVMSVGRNIVNGGQRRLKQSALWTARRAERTATALPRYGARQMANYGGNKLNAAIDKMQKSRSSTVRAVSGSLLVDDAFRGTARRLKSTKAGFARTQEEANKAQSTIRGNQEAWQDVRDGVDASDPRKNTPDSDKIYNPNTGQIVEKASLGAAELRMAEDAQKEREKAKAKMLGRLRDFGIKDYEQLFANDRALFDQIVGELDDGVIDKLMASENLSPADKKVIFGNDGKDGNSRSGRSGAIMNAIEENGVIVASEFEKLGIKQIEFMGDQFIRDNADLFNEDQWEAIKKSEKFTPTQKEAYKAERKARVNQKLAVRTSGINPDVQALIYQNTGTREVTGPGGSKKWVKRIKTDKYRKPKEIAGLPYEALVDPRIIGELPVDAVKQIGRDNAGGKSHLTADEVAKLHAELARNGSAKVKKYLMTTRAQRDFLDLV